MPRFRDQVHEFRRIVRLGSSSPSLQRQRFLLLSSVAPLPWMVGFGTLYWIGLGGHVGHTLAAFVFGAVPSYLVALELGRRGYLHLAAFALIAYATIELSFVSLYTGGLASPSLHWIAVLPAAAALVSRRAAAASWLGCMVVFGGFVVLDALRWPRPLGVSEAFLSQSALPTVAGGGLFAVIFFVLYEHIQREATQTLGVANVELAAARREKEEANQRKARFLSRMSHELRTPFMAILGFTDLMREDAREARGELALALCGMRRNAQHLLQIVSDLIGMTECDADRIDVTQSPMDPRELVDDVMRLLAASAAQKDLVLDGACAADVPETVVSDVARLRQILVNLVGNAIKFTATGKVRLDAAFHARGELVFTVADTGIGMTPDEQERLFAPFGQASLSTTRLYGGTGLGLSISQRLAEALGGGIEVESEAGVGTTFRVRIPARPARPHERASRAGATPALGRSLSHLRVLVVDDMRDNRVLLRTLLERAGARVDVAEDGAVAIGFVRKALCEDALPDVILMDLQMPCVDGRAAMRALRRMGYAGRIIALTADALPETRDRCAREGFDDFATKPIERERLLTLVADSGEGTAPAPTDAPSAPGGDDSVVPERPPFLRRWVDSFVPRGLEGSPAACRQARMVIETALVPAAICPPMLLGVRASMDPKLAAPFIAILALTPLVCLGGLCLMRSTGRIRPIALSLLTYGAAIIATMAALSGGISSFAAPWLTLVPILAFAWFDVRTAVRFTAAALVLWTGLASPAVKAFAGALPPLGVAHTMSLAGCTSFLTALALIYERAKHEATRELDRSNRELARARDAAEAAARAKGRFLATVSHEMRTPIGAILGFAELVRDELALGSAPPIQLAHLDGVERNGRRLLQLLTDLLDLAKLEAGKLELERLPLDPRAWLHAVAEAAVPLARARNLRIDVITDRLPDRIVEDGARLAQVTGQLLDNALRATDEGAVELSAHVPGDTQGWELRIDDRGGGLPASEEARLLRGEVALGDGGLGLGLCAGLGALLDARFEVTRRDGGGTSIRVHLPLRLAKESEPALAGPRTDPRGLPPGCRVLLVEDGLDNQRLIGRVLTRAGARVDLAGDGAIGVDRVMQADSDGQPYDIVLMDMHLPIESGADATRRLRERGFQMPIIALTAESSSDARKRCLSSGCTGFVTKPIDREALVATLARAIERDPAAACRARRRADPHRPTSDTLPAAGQSRRRTESGST